MPQLKWSALVFQDKGVGSVPW